MTFKNQCTAYFTQHALTTHANGPQDLRGYWTKVHQICSRSSFSSTVLTQRSVLQSVHLLLNESGDIKKENNIGTT